MGTWFASYLGTDYMGTWFASYNYLGIDCMGTWFASYLGTDCMGTLFETAVAKFFLLNNHAQEN